MTDESDGTGHGIGPEGVDPALFHEAYEDVAPWDVDHVQSEVAQLLAADRFEGQVLDVGCGTGANALAIADAGHAVTAVDLVPAAVLATAARFAAAAQEGRPHADARFLTGDARFLPELMPGKRFDTIVDAGLFHVFSDADRPMYVASLAAVAEPGTLLHVIVFSEHEPGSDGPRRVTREELRDAFADGWEEEEIVAARYQTRASPDGVRAWRGTWRRSEP